MKQLLITICMILLLSCTNPTLITYDNNQIKYHQVKQKVTNFKSFEQDPSGNIDYLINHLLDEYVYPDLTALEAEKNYKNDPLIKTRITMLRYNALAKAWYDHRMKYLSFQTKAYRLQQIFFRIPDPDRREEITSRAESVMEQVKQGTDFTSLVKRWSEDISATENDGLLEYASLDLMPPSFVIPLESADEGDIIMEILASNDGLHIIRVNDIIVLNERKIAQTKQLNDAFRRIVDLEKQKFWQQSLADLEDKYSITKSYQNLESGDDISLPVLSVADHYLITSELFTYTFAMTMISYRQRSQYDIKPLIHWSATLQQQIKYADTTLLSEGLAVNQAFKQKLDLTSTFGDAYKKASGDLYSDVQRYYMTRETQQVSEAELYIYYNNNREKFRIASNPDEKAQYRPVHEVREIIINDIIVQKKNKVQEVFRQNLIKTYNVVIHRDRILDLLK